MGTTARDGGTTEVLLPRQAASADHQPGSSSAAAHLLRSPVYDSALALAGYELVVAGAATEAQHAEAVAAALTEIPATVLAAGGVLFVRLPRPFLTGDLPLPALPGLTVLEVAE